MPGRGRQAADRLPPLRLPDQSGRRAVVTGASSGIGLATASALAGAGAAVVLAVRDPARGAAAAARVLAEHPDAALRIELVDLGSLASIAAFATRVGGEPVHLLVNNAGLNSSDPSARTVDGLDVPVGVNYLGAWALTAGLWPALVAAAGRVVNLGSLVAAQGRIEAGFGLPHGSPRRSYADSKLAQVVFAAELRRRSAAAGTGVTAAAAHPGWAQTGIFTALDVPPVLDRIGRLSGLLQSPSDGAQPVLLAATEPGPAPYYGPTRCLGASGPPGPARLPRPALRPGIGARLWEISGHRTGIDFEP